MRSCNACKRYVRESKCVFCGAEDLNALPQHAKANGLSRAAMILGAAATAATLTAAGCSSEPDCHTTDCTEDAGDSSAVALYGAVPMDASSDAVSEEASPVALYGAVPADAASDTPAAQPAYGAPSL